MSSPGNYAKGYVRWTAGGKRVMWDGSRWQQLCQIDKCLKRDQKSQGVCLIHFREQQESQLKNGKKKFKVDSSLPSSSSKEKKSSQTTKRKSISKRSKSLNSSKAVSDTDVNQSDTEMSKKSRRSSRQMVLVCSSLTRQQLSQVEIFCKRFPARLSSQVDPKATHLIASEVESRICCLTKKVFFAVAYHQYVIAYQWIDDCLEKQTLLSEENYEILGDASLSSEHNGMHRSRMTRQPIFQSYSYAIAVECAIGCQHGMFNRQELEDLVLLSGATLIRDVRKDELDSNRTLVVLCDDHDKSVLKKYQAIKNPIYYVIPEFFLDSLVLYEVQPIKCYELVFQIDQ